MMDCSGSATFADGAGEDLFEQSSVSILDTRRAFPWYVIVRVS